MKAERNKKLRNLMEEKQKYQLMIQKIDDEIFSMLIDLDNENETPKKQEPENGLEQYQAFVRIRFTPNGREYDYLWNEKYRPEKVLVENMYEDWQQVDVVQCYRRKTIPEGIIYKEAFPIK